MSEEYFELEDAVSDIIDVINLNGGFSVTGWYKKGLIKDRTILHQVNNDDARKYSNGIDDDTVDNSKIIFHPCVVRPTNPDATKEDSELHKLIKSKKFDVNKLLHA